MPKLGRSRVRTAKKTEQPSVAARLVPAFFAGSLALLACLLAYGFTAQNSSRARAERDLQRVVITLNPGNGETRQGSALPAPTPDGQLAEFAVAASDMAASQSQAGHEMPASLPLADASAQTAGPAEVEISVGKTGETLPEHAAANPPIQILPAANASLIETTPEGLQLPMQKDGTTPAAYYARPFHKPKEKALIAFIIPCLGQQAALATRALTLPPEVSLSFSPYAPDLAKWNARARAVGHETYLDMPLANDAAEDAGPLSVTPAHWQADLQKLLGLNSAIVGLFAPEREAFSLDAKRADAVVEELKRRGLRLVAGSSGSGFAHRIAAEGGIGVAADGSIAASTPDELARAFAWAEARAAERKTAIIVLQPSPANFTALENWAAGLPEKSVALAPVSALVSEVKAPTPSTPVNKNAERHNPALEKNAPAKGEHGAEKKGGHE